MRTPSSQQVPFSGRITTLAPSWQPLKRETVVRPLLIFGLLLLFSSAAWADIECKASYLQGEPIIVKVTPTDIPAGAKSKGVVTVSGVSGTWQPDTTKLEYGVWGTSGKHVISALGSWALTDTDGKLLDYGRYDYSKTITINGDQPNPPLPPPPGGKWQVAFFYESGDLDTLPAAQVDMISGMAFRDELKAKGHTFVRGFDKDARGELISEKCETGVCRTTTAGTKWKAYWDATAGQKMPCVVIAPVDGGKCQAFPLPKDRAALYALLDGATK